jgi:hypothetical protein
LAPERRADVWLSASAYLRDLGSLQGSADSWLEREAMTDETPHSAFVREMRGLLDEMQATDSRAERRRLELSMTDTMRRYFGPGGGALCDEHSATERISTAPRRCRASRGKRRLVGEAFDYKLAQAGDK